MKKVLLLGTILLIGTQVMAEGIENASVSVNNKWSIELGVQSQTLEANEVLYKGDDSDDRLSQLNWRMNNVKMFGGKISYKPTDRLGFSFGGYTKVGEYNDKMDDYDWEQTHGGSDLDETDNWDNHTVSKTELDKAINLNVGMNYKVYDGIHNDFFLLGGLSYMNNKWSAYGAHGYHLGARFDDDDRYLVIDYEQKIFTGDLGMEYEFEYNKFELGLSGILGLGYTNTVDNHYGGNNTGTKYEDKDMKTIKFETTVYLGYKFTKNLDTKLSVTGNLTQSYEKGKETATYMDGSGSVADSDLTGFRNKSLITKLSVNYSF